jgi:hypothetical protein
MYKSAYRFDDETIFYFDGNGNKYVARGGSLAWRLNNPGLVHSHSHVAISKSIGSCGRYAIFANAQDGHRALSDWLHCKKYYQSTLKAVAIRYRPTNPSQFIDEVVALSALASNRKLSSLNNQEFERLLKVIEKSCGYLPLGNEEFALLPKINAKIENAGDQKDTYLVGNNVILSKNEAIEWIRSHRLDGVVVHELGGAIRLRSRPSHRIMNIHIPAVAFQILPNVIGQIDTLVRTVGEYRPGQCIWGFINGIFNNRKDALESANLITKAANGERVLFMPNDTAFLGDLAECLVLKCGQDTLNIGWTVKFFRYLLSLSVEDRVTVVIFVHSQGAIFSEHALELLSPQEREQLRIVTFGGGSFIAPGKSHTESHNYVSAADLIPAASPNLQRMALRRYYGHKQNLSQQQVIMDLALEDSLFYLDSSETASVDAYLKKCVRYYEDVFLQLSNVTVLDPDPDSRWKHRFDSICYQVVLEKTIQKYQREQSLKRNLVYA